MLWQLPIQRFGLQMYYGQILTKHHLLEAIEEYQKRRRRYGGV